MTAERLRYGVLFTALLAFLLSETAVPGGKAWPAEAQGEALRTVVQSGHNNNVRLLAFSNDERLLVSMDSFGKIKLWRLPDGRLINSWTPGKAAGQPDADDVAGLAFDRSGNVVTVTGGVLSTWNPATGAVVRTERLPVGKANEFALSRDGRVLASWHRSEEPEKAPSPAAIELWDVQSARRIRSFSTPKADGAVLSASGEFLASIAASDRDYVLNVRRVSDGASAGAITVDNPAMQSRGRQIKRFRIDLVSVSPDGQLLAVAIEDEQMRQATGKTQKALSIRRVSGFSEARSFEYRKYPHGFFSADGKWLVLKGNSGLRVVNTGDWSDFYSVESKEPVMSLALSPKKTYLAEGAGAIHGSGMFFQTYLVTLHDLASRSARPVYEEGKWIDNMAVSPDGGYLVLNEQRSSRDIEKSTYSLLRLFSLRDWKPVWEKEIESDRIKGMAYSDDGRYLVAQTFEELFVWRMPDGQQAARMKLAYDKFSLGIAISPHGEYVSAVDGRNPLQPVTTLLRVRDGAPVARLESSAQKEREYVQESQAFSPDGAMLARVLYRSRQEAGREESPRRVDVRVELWDVKSGKPAGVIDAGQYSEDETSRSLQRQLLAFDALAFSRDRALLLVGRKVFRVSDGKQAASISTPADLQQKGIGEFYLNSRSLSVSPRGGVFADIFGEGEGVRIWDLKSGKQRATLFTMRDNSVAVTPEGYFSGNGEFSKYVHFVKGGAVYDFNQFYDTFYRPDLVEMKLRGEDISPYTEGLSIEEALKNPPPRVAFSEIPATSANREVSVRYKIAGTGGGIGEVRLFHNGKLIQSDGYYREAKKPTRETASLKDNNTRAIQSDLRGIAIAARQEGRGSMIDAAPKGDAYEGSVTIDAVSGENEIGVAAFNRNNTVQSSIATSTFKSSRMREDPHLHVLAVGIDRYKAAGGNLRYAVRDAESIARVLGRPSPALYKPGNMHIRTITNEEAGKAKILGTIRELSGAVRPGDTFVLFIAAHGVMRSGLYSIVTHDYDGRLGAGSLISSNEIMDISKNIKALTQIYILDTCHAGGLDNFVSSLYDARMTVLAKNMGLHMFASASSTQEALDGYRGKNGVFTYALLEGLRSRGGDRNRDGKVSIYELGSYAKEKTVRYSKEAGHTQTPIINNFGRDVIIYEVRQD